jgi:hypothetical protein
MILQSTSTFIMSKHPYIEYLPITLYTYPNIQATIQAGHGELCKKREKDNSNEICKLRRCESEPRVRDNIFRLFYAHNHDVIIIIHMYILLPIFLCGHHE